LRSAAFHLSLFGKHQLMHQEEPRKHLLTQNVRINEEDLLQMHQKYSVVHHI
jgi:hypothetical protein